MTMYDGLLFAHMIGLAMAVGTSFCMRALGRAAADMAPPDRAAFMLRALAVIKVAGIGFAILIASGIGMLSLEGLTLMKLGGQTFMVKLALVGVQMGLFGFMQVTVKKVKAAQGGPLMARLPKIGRALLLNGVGIVLAAVLAFH